MNNTDEIQNNFTDAYTRAMSQQIFDRAITQLREGVTTTTDTVDDATLTLRSTRPFTYTGAPVTDREYPPNNAFYTTRGTPNPWAEISNPFRPSYKIDDSQDVFYHVKGKKIGIAELLERVEYLEAVVAKLMGPQVEEMKI